MSWSKDTVAKMLPVMEAWQQGKTIQARHIGGPCLSDVWFDINDKEPCFENPTLQWRVKPEAVLRPWTFEEIPVGVLVTPKLKDGNRRQVKVRQILGKTHYGTDEQDLSVIHLVDENMGMVYALKSWSVCDEEGVYVGPCGVPE